MSPRFYGQGQPPYFGKPEDVSRDLLHSLQRGMSELKQTTQQQKEGRDPMHAIRVQQQSNPFLATQVSETLNLAGLPPYLSQLIVNPGAQEDIMNMGMDELDTLKL